MTKRAKRLAKYLENDLGWEVFSKRTDCPKCGNTVCGDPFCPQCGTKQGKPTHGRNETIDEIEKAIAYAIGDA